MKNVTMLATLGALALSSVALAKGDKGAFTLVLPSGQTVSGRVKTTIALAPGATLKVRGRYAEFDVDGDTFAVRNFTLTGFNPRDGVTAGVRTPIFASRVPLHGATLAGAVSVEIKDEQLVIQRSGPGITMKIQAKDMTQGGMFQMEPSRTIDYSHELAAGFRYQFDPLGRVVLTNGRFFVRESPELASLKTPASLIPAGTFSIWTVGAGGRMGIVVGEDALQP